MNRTQYQNSGKMKLKKDIIERIRGNKEAVPALMDSLGKSRQLINRMLRKNEDDGPLTTINALNTIQNVLGIEDVNDLVDRILEPCHA